MLEISLRNIGIWGSMEAISTAGTRDSTPDICSK